MNNDNSNKKIMLLSDMAKLIEEGSFVIRIEPDYVACHRLDVDIDCVDCLFNKDYCIKLRCSENIFDLLLEKYPELIV